MAPFTSSDLYVVTSDGSGDHVVISGSWNEEWRLGESTLGGYPVALNVQAAQIWTRLTMKQSYAQRTEDLHIDPLHVSTTFLNATSVKTPYQIKVHALKRGRSVTHLEVQFCQPSTKTGLFTPALISHMLFNSFASRSRPDAQLQGPTLAPSDPHYYICPLFPPPSPAAPVSRHYKGRRFGFGDRVSVWPDERFNAEADNVHGQGVAFGAWLQLTGDPEIESTSSSASEAERLRSPSQWIPIACDLFWNPATILGIKSDTPVWFPTMSLAIEYKQRIPHNARIKRWGHISRSRAMQNGQYENDAEIFTHPEDNHLLDPPRQASDGPQLIAISRQIGLTIDMARQMGRPSAATSSSKDVATARL